MYKMRGLPCRVNGQELPWYVGGQFRYTCEDGTVVTGGGVLEWCWSRADAENLLRKMKRDSRFSKLSVGHI